jgi:iron-sulfur cluster assembly protein
MFQTLQPVSISAKAAEEIRKIMQTKNIPSDYALRIGVRGGGCSGVSLMIGFDKAKASDLQYEVEGIPVLVDKKHTMYIIGKQVDFHESSDARGFLFTDPESTSENS